MLDPFITGQPEFLRLSTLHHWFNQLQALLVQETCVLLTLSQIMGSAPRESGCRMVVTTDSTTGSIGGGNLEYTAIAQARRMLAESEGEIQRLQSFGLGPALNQCCGGAVSLHFERIPAGKVGWLDELITAQTESCPAILLTAVDAALPLHHVLTAGSARPLDVPEPVWQAAVQRLRLQPRVQTPASSDQSSFTTVATESGNWWLERIEDHRPELFLFGAGHVGQEVARMLRGLPFNLSWIDERTDIFPQDAAHHCTLIGSDPLAVVASAKANNVFVVMTHSHQLDEAICGAVLQRQDADWDFLWLGLIGSDTKRKRFIHRLKQSGLSDQQLQRLVCPIGLSGIHGKQPATIALSLLAQLMMESTWTDAEN